MALGSCVRARVYGTPPRRAGRGHAVHSSRCGVRHRVAEGNALLPLITLVASVGLPSASVPESVLVNGRAVSSDHVSTNDVVLFARLLAFGRTRNSRRSVSTTSQLVNIDSAGHTNRLDSVEGVDSSRLGANLSGLVKLIDGHIALSEPTFFRRLRRSPAKHVFTCPSQRTESAALRRSSPSVQQGEPAARASLSQEQTPVALNRFSAHK